MLLIDLSYFIFYRYFATYSWYKKQNGSRDDVMRDPVFLEKYDKIFEQTIVDLQKKHEIASDQVYFAKDCQRDEIWRVEHYADYKKGREERLETFDKEIFKHSICDTIPALQAKHGGFHLLSVDKLEADDIVAVVKSHVRRQNTEREIVIVTNDNDYLQLIDDYTLVVNLQGRDLKSRIDVDPVTYLQQKIIVGDKSDNIPSIAKKIGEKTSAKLAADADALASLFKKNPDAKSQYELNRLLISFEYIPEALRKRAVESYIKTIDN